LSYIGAEYASQPVLEMDAELVSSQNNEVVEEKFEPLDIKESTGLESSEVEAAVDNIDSQQEIEHQIEMDLVE